MVVRYDDGVDGVSAFVLAGGKSSRMGADKALLPLSDGNFLTVALRNARSVCPDPIIVGDSIRYRKYGEVVEDRFTGCGPLGGIHAALYATRDEWNLILSVDLPMMTPEFLRWLVGEAVAGDKLVTVPRLHGRSETLCAVYRKSILPVVERALMAGDFKVGQIYSALPVRYVSEEEIGAAGFREDIFRNVNAPDDYDWVKRQLADAGITATSDRRG